MRRLLIGLAVLAGLIVAGDFGLRLYSQSVVSDELAASLKLSEKPKVTFGGWPFLTHALAGDLPSATVKSTDVVAEGVPIHAVNFALEDLTFPVSRLLSGG